MTDRADAVRAAIEGHFEIAAVELRQDKPLYHRVPRCGKCRQLWPCDATILAAEAERLRAVLEAARGVIRTGIDMGATWHCAIDAADTLRDALAALDTPAGDGSEGR